MAVWCFIAGYRRGDLVLNQSLLHFFTDASPIVKAVMVLLLSASVFSWMLIIQKASFFARVRRHSKKFAKRFCSGEDLNQLYQQDSNEQGKLSGQQLLFNAGYAEFLRLKQRQVNRETLIEGVERAMDIAMAKQQACLEGSLSTLATIGSISPYVGLFGTVWGIMMSFQALGAVQQATIAMVAPGISEALIATAMGLFAAIPAVIAYNRFVARIENISNDFIIFRDELINLLLGQIYLVPKASQYTPGVAHEPTA